MLRSVWPLLIESAMILLQTVPTHIDIEELKKKLLQQCDGVLAVHEFHIWQLAGDRIIASAHIRSQWVFSLLLYPLFINLNIFLKSKT